MSLLKPRSSPIWLFGSWVNVLRVSFYYNNIGLIVELRLQYWDFFSGWVNLTHLLFTYDNDYNIIEGLWQDWDTGTSSWINYSRTTSTYRSGNIPLNDLTELWIENTWIFDSLRSYAIDNNSNLSYIINQNGNGTWINYTRELFAYITDVGDEDNYPLKFELKQNYANPFDPGTSIQYAVSCRQLVSLKVYDILGNEVAILVSEEKAPGSYEVSFNAAECGSGVYIYSLSRAGLDAGASAINPERGPRVLSEPFPFVLG